MTVWRPPPEPAAGGPDRLARALEHGHFNTALARLTWRDYTHVMKLDGDIELPPTICAN